MKNASRIALLSVVAALVLAGCVRVQFDVTVADDNTVDGSIVLAIQKGIGESLGLSDDELIAEISSGVYCLPWISTTAIPFLPSTTW